MKTAKRMMMVLVVMVMAVMVLPNTSAKAAKVAGKLNKKNVYLAINDGENDKISKETAKYTLKLTGVSKKTAKKAKWSSANKKIATVNKKGTVTGKKHGSTKIICKVGKTKYTCKVYVNDIQKVIKGTANLMANNFALVTTSKYRYTHAAYNEGLISADEVSDSESFADFGHKVTINGHYYFFYYQDRRWFKKYVHIKEGRLNSSNPWAKNNVDPEIQKQIEEEEAKEKAEAEKKKEKAKAEAEAAAKADAERQAQMEAERKAEIDAKNKEIDEAIEKALALGGTVTETDDGQIIVQYKIDGIVYSEVYSRPTY